MSRMEAENKAQQIILKRSGAVKIENGRSILTNQFNCHASKFRELRKKGFNFVQIERELRNE